MSRSPRCRSNKFRERVEHGRQRQRERLAAEKGVYCNAHMGRKLLKKHCELNEECRALLSRAVTHYGLSARAHDRILKVARTIADLAGSDAIAPEHLAEAIQYRSLDRTTML